LQAACWIIGVAFLICAWNPAEPGDIVCELAEYAVAITSAAAKNAIANFCMLISNSMHEGELTLSAGPSGINVIVAFDPGAPVGYFAVECAHVLPARKHVLKAA
jgi:hypothetical protein